MDFQRLFIVVIDDSPTVCQFLEEGLCRKGHQVTSFQDPSVALRSILKTGETPRPDLLFIDLILPKISGYEVIQRFKSNPASGHIPILAISRLGGVRVRLNVQLAGATAYLEKPFQIQEVVAFVQRFAAFPPITTNK